MLAIQLLNEENGILAEKVVECPSDEDESKNVIRDAVIEFLENGNDGIPIAVLAGDSIKAVELQKFYFTFGSEGQLYNGGWVLIHAVDKADAIKKFKKRYKEKSMKNHKLNYSLSYYQEDFEATRMFSDGNFGVYCHEVII